MRHRGHRHGAHRGTDHVDGLTAQLPEDAVELDALSRDVVVEILAACATANHAPTHQVIERGSIDRLASPRSISCEQHQISHATHCPDPKAVHGLGPQVCLDHGVEEFLRFGGHHLRHFAVRRHRRSIAHRCDTAIEARRMSKTEQWVRSAARPAIQQSDLATLDRSQSHPGGRRRSQTRRPSRGRSACIYAAERAAHLRSEYRLGATI